MNQITEIWSPATIAGYEVSTLGRIKNTRSQVIRAYKKNKAGYCEISIKGKSILVHRLVATTFVPNPEGKPEVHHINNVRDDNRAENLGWATRTENNAHQYLNNACKYGSPDTKIKISKMCDILNMIRKGHSAESISVATSTPIGIVGVIIPLIEK